MELLDDQQRVDPSALLEQVKDPATSRKNPPIPKASANHEMQRHDPDAADLVHLTSGLVDQLSLRCPRPTCQRVVDPGPDGCANVRCGHCSAKVCWVCFAWFGGSDADEKCYRHLRGHRLSNIYFPSKVEVKDGHAKVRDRQIDSYLAARWVPPTSGTTVLDVSGRGGAAVEETRAERARSMGRHVELYRAVVRHVDEPQVRATLWKHLESRPEDFAVAARAKWQGANKGNGVRGEQRRERTEFIKWAVQQTLLNKMRFLQKNCKNGWRWASEEKTNTAFVSACERLFCVEKGAEAQGSPPFENHGACVPVLSHDAALERCRYLLQSGSVAATVGLERCRYLDAQIGSVAHDDGRRKHVVHGQHATRGKHTAHGDSAACVDGTGTAAATAGGEKEVFEMGNGGRGDSVRPKEAPVMSVPLQSVKAGVGAGSGEAMRH